MILLGAGIGVIGSTVNPFATGIASGLRRYPIGDGLSLRLVVLVVGLALGIVFVMRYAEKVQKDPSKSLVFDAEGGEREAVHVGRPVAEDFGAFTGRHKLILVLFLSRSWRWFTASFRGRISGVHPDLGGGGSPR